MLRNLKQYVNLLNEIAQTERTQFLKNSIKIGATKYLLQITIETCLYIGNHITAAEDLRAPKD